MKKILLIALLFNLSVFAECIHEKRVSGSQLLQLSQDHDIWIKNQYHQFSKLQSNFHINPVQNYIIQFRPRNLQVNFSGSNEYNSQYLPYYTVSRMKLFIKRNKRLISRRGYKINQIGTSVKGEPLFYIGPQQLDYNKKTIVMFGRHHGDEGTANWIIEGFFHHFIHTDYLMDKYNLLLYPMINPDGANKRVRYNANGRDLNRSWGVDGKRSFDEIVSIYSHLEKQFTRIKKPMIVLDMHGSFTKDFIYRVDKSFKGAGFYNLQQAFISKLSQRDKWQNGSFQLSNGDAGMSRIRLINRFGLNAMTHETPRDIPIQNNKNRTVRTLMDQGVAIAYTINELY